MRVSVLTLIGVLLTHQASALVEERPEAPRRGLVTSDVVGLRERSGGTTPSGVTATTAASTAADRASTSVWGWPLAGVPPILRGFDPPEHRWSAGHRGIDLAGVEGEAVLAVEAGVVTHSGVIAGVGTVSITHASGLRSTYQPLTDRVSRGERVSRGAMVGRLDAGHCALLGCLHLGAVRGQHGYVDPTPLLLGVDLSLRPVTGTGQ